MKLWPFGGGEVEARDSLENPSMSLAAALQGAGADFSLSGSLAEMGVPVNEDTALTFGAVYASIRVIAETLASLPFHLYERQGQSRVQADYDPRAYLLNEEPNPEMDSMILWEIALAHLNLWGNAYLYKELDPGTGMPVALWPLQPNATRPVKLPDGTLAFATQLDTGEIRGLTADEVIHIRAFGTGKGNVGLSPIGVARRAIGIGIAADEYAGRFFANDGRPGGVLYTDKPMNDEQFQTFKRRWDAQHKGLTNKHLIGILDNGLRWQDVGIPPGDMQFLESRKWQKREIATVFRVPPHKIGDAEPGAVSYASVEQFSQDFVDDTLRPWATRIEKAVKRGMFGSALDRNLYPKFQLNGLLRGDMQSRSAFYKDGIEAGWLLRSEARELEDLPYLEGMDKPLVADLGDQKIPVVGNSNA